MGKRNPPRVGGFFFLVAYVLATYELIEFDNQAVLWEGDTSTNVDSINHTDIELVAVVWLDVEVVAVLLEAIADAWVENSNILLGSISVPEWVLGGEGSLTFGGRTNSHPWAAHQDDDISMDAEDFLNAWSQFKARKFPSLEGVDALGSEVEVVRSFNALDEFGCEFLGDEYREVQIAVAINHVLDSFRNDTTSILSNRTLVSPEVGWVSLSDERINGGSWSSYETVDNFVPEVNFTAKLISTLGERILFGEQSGVPEVFVLVAHADAVCVFAVEAEAKFVKLWKSVDARNFTVKNDMNMTFIFAVSSIFQIALLIEREWVLVFLDRDDELLTILEVAQKGSCID